jgi:hypothetical protein
MKGGSIFVRAAIQSGHRQDACRELFAVQWPDAARPQGVCRSMQLILKTAAKSTFEDFIGT